MNRNKRKKDDVFSLLDKDNINNLIIIGLLSYIIFKVVKSDSTHDEPKSKKSNSISREDYIDKLNNTMSKLVEREEYERAAKLRDKIAKLRR